MNDTQLRAFLAAARTLNFSAAAEQLYLQPQTVSKYVLQLERELDAPLFSRRAGRLELTNAGRLYRDLFARSLDELSSLARYNTDSVHRLRRRFRLGLSSWLSIQNPLGDALSSFFAQQPQLMPTVRLLDNLELRRAFDCDELDLVILSSDFFSPSVDTDFCTLAPECLSLYAPDWVEGDRIDPECWQLPYLQCAAWEWSYLEWQHISRSVLSESDQRPPKLILLPNTNTIRSVMRLRQSVAVTDRFFGILRDIPGLRCFPMDIRPNVVAVWKKYNESPLIPELTDFVRAYFSPGGPGFDHIST